MFENDYPILYFGAPINENGKPSCNKAKYGMFYVQFQFPSQE